MRPRALILTLAASLVLSFGCGGDDPTSPTTTAAPAGPSQPAPVPTPTPAPTVTITSLDVNPSVFVAGQNVQGTLTLSDAAQGEGTVVMLSSTHPAYASVPASITVPAGTSTGRFQVQTQTVQAETAVDIAGSAGGETRAKTIRLQPRSGELALVPSSDVIGAEQTAELTARLTAPASSGGLRVTLTADGLLTVPPVVTIAEGGTSATVNITARSVTSEAGATITGTANGQTRTASLRVWPVFLQISSTPGEYVAQGQSFRIDASPSAVFNGNMWGSNSEMNISVNNPSDFSRWWSVAMAAPGGRALVPGVYRDARRIPPIGSNLPTLRVAGNGRGCNQSTGEFEVLEAAYGPGFGGISGTIQRFRATFKQTCDEAPGSQLSGEIRLATILVTCKFTRNC